MNEDELKKLWQAQPLRGPDFPAAQVISAMQNKMTAFRRTLFWRDVRELSACAVLAVVFGFYFFHQHAPMARLGDLMVIAALIFIAWKLMRARRATPPAPPGATIVESLRAELNSVRAQAGLLGSVLWWYLLPLTIGEMVFIWGDLNPADAATWWVKVPSNLIATLVVFGVNVLVYWLNQWARSKNLLPMETQLQTLLRSAETGEPVDQTQVASLRPIVLSMAAADQVKPVEFKVAFWQIALFGEIGFIGIWFFLMIGLTLDNGDGKPKEPARETFPQTVQVAETNRYSVVARKVIALFNAGDYAAVQKLYNPEMGEAFPPKETAGFYTRLAAGFGHIEKMDGPTTNGYHGWTAFRVDGQDGELTMSLALDANDQISGIYFEPASGLLWNIKSLFPRVFTWVHLLWLIPFFVAGLFYSRILQKSTERAVGLSTLGVHLRKGQNLILWDEIKEVRAFKLLHIRSLWLIRESGEKTLMPWTSLERQAELKAAVEGLAPANHPMRGHLFLLTRTRTK